MTKFRLFVALLVVLIGTKSCHKSSTENTRIETNKSAPKKAEISKRKASVYNEPFHTFSNRFHSDSLFQLKRIKIPLEGYSVNPEGIETAWEKDKWLMHRMSLQQIETSEFKLTITEKPGIRIENSYLEESSFRTQRVFKQIKG